jgi:hypothetical protein
VRLHARHSWLVLRFLGTSLVLPLVEWKYMHLHGWRHSNLTARYYSRVELLVIIVERNTVVLRNSVLQTCTSTFSCKIAHGVRPVSAIPFSQACGVESSVL